jgi:hypothetical protein|tara:strand:- start:284 stop:889 length:606 start_codon:yes stop_codon:yes gene_type:complete
MKGGKMARKKSIHYVNNSDFSTAVVTYVEKVEEAKKNEATVPKVPDYIATCFLRIAEGLSHKANFIRYTYREEMVMDAVENCLKAISNYNLEAATRTGKPNAFAYFTQITWYAFLRRITKEKKQQEIKLKYLTKAGIENFVDNDLEGGGVGEQVSTHFVDTLRDRIERVRTTDKEVKEFVKIEKKKRRSKTADSDLSEFMQ